MRIRPVARIAATLMLLAIGLEIVDTHCDQVPILGSQSNATVSGNRQPVGADDDACSTVCVPDCYNCSRPDVATAVILISKPRLIPDLLIERASHPVQGVRPVPFRPPLHLL